MTPTRWKRPLAAAAASVVLLTAGCGSTEDTTDRHGACMAAVRMSMGMMQNMSDRAVKVSHWLQDALLEGKAPSSGAMNRLADEVEDSTDRLPTFFNAAHQCLGDDA